MNILGSEVTGMRGGIHNSVTRVCPKPTHMIGGYAQLALGALTTTAPSARTATNSS